MKNQALRKATEENNKNFFEDKTEAENQNNLKSLRAKPFSEIEAKTVEWLWKPLIALGTFVLFEGEEGIGKTFIICALATAVASGKGLPDVSEDEHIEPSNVILISAEDSLPYVLKNRLQSMNAPCERIIGCDEPFTLDKDGIFRLSMLIEKYKPKLVIIDPLFSYTGRINLDRDSDIRSVTDELKRLAEKHHCTIVGIRHIGKSKGLGDARNAGLNGIGWRASARSVVLAGKNPENEKQRAICQTKNNLAPIYEKSIGYEIRKSDNPEENPFFWTGESSLTPELILSTIRHETTEEKSEKHDAMSFLRLTLGNKRKLATDVQKEAKDLAISEATLRRAKNALGVRSEKDSNKNGKWFWQLPEGVHEGGEDAQINKSEHLHLNSTDKTSYDSNLTEDAQPVILEHLQSQSEHLQPLLCPEDAIEMKLSPDAKGYFCEICMYKIPEANVQPRTKSAGK